MRGARAVLAAVGACVGLGAQGPQQLSLALTAAGPTEMAIAWVSLDAWTPATAGSVTWASSATPEHEDSAPARTHTYSAGFGWNGSIFWATMTGLAPSVSYTYTVEANGNRSTPRVFHAAPRTNASASARVAVLADMGTVELLGFEVAAELIREHAANPFDLSFISGDLSYATVDPPNFEIQGLWDAWGQQDEPFASTAPFMMTVGNHESTPGTLTNASGTFPVEFAAFTSRWEMPRNGRGNYYYYYDFAPARFVALNTEEDYSKGSAQWTWLDATLAATDRAATPWLFVSLHRPVLSADADEAGAHVPGSPLSVALEPLMLKYKVDVVQQGHQHCYDRTAAVYNGTIVGLPDASGTYAAPAAPVYINQATAGAVMDSKFITPTPAWSLVRGTTYGFGRMHLSTDGASRVLRYEYVSTNGTVVDQWAIVKPV